MTLNWILNSSKWFLSESTITLESKHQFAHLALSVLVSAEHIESEKVIVIESVFSLGSPYQLCSCLLLLKNTYKDVLDPNMRICQ